MTLNAAGFEPLKAWIGRESTAADHCTAGPLHALAATLGHDDALPQPGDPVRPGGQWLYFLPVVPLSQVGEDGHPQRGGFLPPVPLPRRMWAGGRLDYHRPLRVGERVGRTSRIANVTLKEGRSGALVFITVEHRYTGADGDVAIEERQDLVFRAATPSDAPAAAPALVVPAEPPRPDAPWQRRVLPDPVLLFRYSALTFNGHRIHYDRPYATAVEGYPGLVVHGPLIATLLQDLVHRQRPAAQLRRFEFKAHRPLFDGAPFDLCGAPSAKGNEVGLWAQDAAGEVCLSASALLA